MIAPNTISTDKFIRLLDNLIKEEHDQPQSISEPIMHQICGLIRLITGEKISHWNISDVKDVYDLIGWDYKIKNSEINFIRKR